MRMSSIRARIFVWTGLLALLFAAVPAYALPTGGEIVTGEGSINESGDSLTVRQESDFLAVDWQTFSVGEDELVLFVQPGADAVALNRVLGDDPSEIFGRLKADGQVFLVNPHGIVFSETARVDVGGLVASALDVSVERLADGTLSLEALDVAAGSESAGRVVNRGEIAVAEGGAVAFLGTYVENAGWVLAPLGTVAAGAGERVTLGLDGRNLVSFGVEEAALDALVTNSGSIAADGGMVVLEARAQNALFDSVINVDGIIEARSLGEEEGVVVLRGGDAGVVEVSGTLDASGDGAAGGYIEVTGAYIALDEGARLRAAGAPGGQILVGGDYQGGSPVIPNARGVFVGEDVVLDASGRGYGAADGGRVIVWSDEATRFYGLIRATGAEAGGHGGFAEVSSPGYLDFRGLADLRAPRGKAGTLLLDPTDITISNGADGGGSWNPDPEDPAGRMFQPPDVADVTINVNTLISQLGAGNVVITTASQADGAGVIRIDADIVYDGAEERTLTFLASHHLRLSSGRRIVSTQAPLNVELKAAAGGTLQLQDNSEIKTLGGNVLLHHGWIDGEQAATSDSGIRMGAGAIVNTGGGRIDVIGTSVTYSSSAVSKAIAVSGAAINSFGGDITFDARGPVGVPIELAAGTSVDAGDGTLTFKMPGGALDPSDAALAAHRLVLHGPDADFHLTGDNHEFDVLGAVEARNLGIAAHADTLTLDGAVNVDQQMTVLGAGSGSVKQTSGGSLNVSQLVLDVPDRDVTLENSGNTIGAVRGSAAGFSLKTSGPPHGAVLTVDGLSVSGDVTLQNEGGIHIGDGGLTVGGVAYLKVFGFDPHVTQSGAVTAHGLAVDGASGTAVVLGYEGNSIENIAVKAGALLLVNNSLALTVASLVSGHDAGSEVRGVTIARPGDAIAYADTAVLRQLQGVVTQDGDAPITLSNTGRLALLGDADFRLDASDNRIAWVAADVNNLTLATTGDTTYGELQIDSVSATGVSVSGVTAESVTLHLHGSASVRQSGGEARLDVDELSIVGMGGAGRTNDALLGNGVNRVARLRDVQVDNLDLVLDAGGLEIVGDVTVTGRFYVKTSGDVTQGAGTAIQAGTVALYSTRAQDAGSARFALDSTLNVIGELAAYVAGGTLEVTTASDVAIVNEADVHGIDAQTFILRIEGRHTASTGDGRLTVGELRLVGPEANFSLHDTMVTRLRSARARNLSLALGDTVVGGPGADDAIDVAENLTIVIPTNNSLVMDGDIAVGGVFVFDGRDIVQRNGAIKAGAMGIRGRGGTAEFVLNSAGNEFGVLAVQNVHSLSVAFTGDLEIGAVDGIDGITLSSGASSSTLRLTLSGSGTLTQSAGIVTDRLHVDAPRLDLVLDDTEQPFSNRVGALASARVNSLHVSQNVSWTLGSPFANDIVSVAENLYAAARGADSDLNVRGTVEYRGDGAGEMRFEAWRGIVMEAGRIEPAPSASGRVDVILNANRGDDGTGAGRGNIRLDLFDITTGGGFIAMGGGRWDSATQSFSAPAVGLVTGSDRERRGIDLFGVSLDAGDGWILMEGRGTVGVSLDDAEIRSGAGDIVLRGTGDGADAGYGVMVDGSSVASDAGDITITGRAESDGAENHGVFIAMGAVVSMTGDMTLEGRAQAGSSGIAVETGTIGHENATGDIRLMADNESGSRTLNFTGSNVVNSLGTLYVQPLDNRTMIVGPEGFNFYPVIAGSGFGRIVIGRSGSDLIIRRNQGLGFVYEFSTDVELLGNDITFELPEDAHLPRFAVGDHTLTLRSAGTVDVQRGIKFEAENLLLDGGASGVFNLGTAWHDVTTFAMRGKSLDIIVEAPATIGSVDGVKGITATDSARLTLARDLSVSASDAVLEQDADAPILTSLLALVGEPYGNKATITLTADSNQVDALRLEKVRDYSVLNLSFINVGDLDILESDLRGQAHVTTMGRLRIVGEVRGSFDEFDGSFLTLTAVGTVDIDAPLAAKQLLIAPVPLIGGSIDVKQADDAPLNVGELYVGPAGTVLLEAGGNEAGRLGARARSFVYRGQGSVTLADLVVDDTAEVVVNGDITVDKGEVFEVGVSAGGSGDAIVLAAVDGDFHVTADAGSHPLQTTGGGRFLVYSTDPTRNNLGGFASPGNLFGRTFRDNGPETIDPQWGSRMIYVARPLLKVRADDVTGLVYGDAHDFSRLTWTYESGLVDGDTIADALVIELTTTLWQQSPAGLHAGAVTASRLESPLGYDIEFTPGDVEILPAQLTVQGHKLYREYGAANPTPGPEDWTVIGLKPWDLADLDAILEVSAEVEAEPDDPVGDDYVVRLSVRLNTGNYTVNVQHGTLEITPAPLKIVGDSLTRRYGDPNPGATWTVDGLKPWDTEDQVLSVDWIVHADERSPAGDGYVVELFPTVLSGNYKLDPADVRHGTMVIKPALLRVIGGEVSKVYGDPNPAAKWTVEGLKSWDKEEDVISVGWNVHAEQRSSVGKYVIELLPTVLSANYELAGDGVVPGVLVIEPAMLKVVGERLSRVYGGTNPAPKWTVHGVMPWDDEDGILSVTGSVEADEKSPVGDDYVVRLSANLFSGNYYVELEHGTLEITPAPLKIVGDRVFRTYGRHNPALTWTYEGLMDWDEIDDVVAVVAETDADETSDVGEYAVRLRGHVISPNYDVTFDGGSLIVTPAELIVRAVDATRPHGAPNPAFAVVYEGFVLGHDASIFEGELRFDTTAAPASPPGAYRIRPYGLALRPEHRNNYTLKFVDGTLTVFPFSDPVLPGVPEEAYRAALRNSYGWLGVGSGAPDATADAGSSVGDVEERLTVLLPDGEPAK